MAPSPFGTTRETTLSIFKSNDASALSSEISSISTALSSSEISFVKASLIPRTPVAKRPIARTAFSAKRTTRPCDENNIISLLPSVISTPINSSSSRKFNAMIPFERGRLNSVKAIFFTIPPAVAITTNLSSS